MLTLGVVRCATMMSRLKVNMNEIRPMTFIDARVVTGIVVKWLHGDLPKIMSAPRATKVYCPLCFSLMDYRNGEYRCDEKHLDGQPVVFPKNIIDSPEDKRPGTLDGDGN